MKSEFWFWLHLLLLIPAYFSFILFDWWLIVFGVIVLQIQYLLIGGCFLTHLEMGKDKNETFIWYYLQKIYPRINPVKTKFVIRFVVPVLIIATALVVQVKFGFQPMIHF